MTVTRYSTVVTSGATTEVKRVVVGTPVRRVTAGAFSIDNLGGVDTTGKTNGGLLVYNSTSGNFEVTIDLEEQNINGGQY